MNLVLIGGKATSKLSDVLYQSFDDIVIFSYADVMGFVEEASLRVLDIHRVLLTQDGFESVDDDNIYSFTDFLTMRYPAVKLITLCKEKEYVKYMAELFPGSNYAHFFVQVINGKMLQDMASLDIPLLSKKYSTLIYTQDSSGVTEFVDEVIPSTVVPEEQEIQGYVPQPTNLQKEPKRGIFKKIFGIAPKQKNKSLTRQGELKEIGQGFGVDDFTPISPVDFSDIENTNNEEYTDYSVFAGDSDNNLGLGLSENESEYTEEQEDNSDYQAPLSTQEDIISQDIPDDELDDLLDGLPDDLIVNSTTQVQNSDGSEFNSRPVVYLEKKEAIETPEAGLVVHLEKQNSDSVVNEEPRIFDVPTEKEPEVGVERSEIIVPSVDLNALKNQILTDSLNLDNIPDVPNMPSVEDMPTETIVDEDNTEVSLFDANIDSLMTHYEEENTKVVEKIVERVVTVNVGEAAYRNKRGVKILVVTGDRRIGVTKLAMNLASVYAQREKVLYVDFDRYRKGSLSYLDLNDLLADEKHVQDGINHLKSLKVLKNVTYLSKKGGFYCLLSMYGTNIEDEQMILAQQILAHQTEFTTIIVDCPLENIYLLKELLHDGHILLCSDDTYTGVMNLTIELSTCVESEAALSDIYQRAGFVVGRRGNIDRFQGELCRVADLFDFESQIFDWSKLEVLGTLRNIRELAERVGD